MSIEEALRAHLITFSSVSTRIYPLKLPQNPTLPAITYQKITSIINYLRDGGTNEIEDTFQIDIWGKTYSEVKTVANTIKSSLIRTTSLDEMAVISVWVDDENDFYESDTDLYRVMLYIRILY